MMLLLITFILSGLSGLLQAEELPGYPQDVLSAKANYECYEGEQLKNVKSRLLYDLCLDKKLTAGARNTLHQSFLAFVDRLADKRFLSCIQSVAPGSDFGVSPGFLEKHLFGPLGARLVSDKTYFNAEVFISALALEDSDPRFSEGYLGFYDNPAHAAIGKDWRKHISIAVNPRFVGSLAHPFGNDTSFWAAQLAIAYFKNIGFKEETNSFESFSRATGECILWAGAERKQ